MSDDPRTDQLDLRLDQALASYTPQHSRPGLETRILQSITAKQETSAQISYGWLWAWPASLVGLATLALIIVSATNPPMRMRRLLATSAAVLPATTGQAPVPQSSTSPSRSHNTILVQHIPLSGLLRHKGETRHRQLARPQPQYGLPRATKEERMLATLAGVQQSEQLLASLDTTNRDDAIQIAPIPDQPIALEPVKISAIATQPIQIDGIN